MLLLQLLIFVNNFIDEDQYVYYCEFSTQSSPVRYAAG